MIASHLLAYFFTELNHDQVQKVSKRGRGWLARLWQTCVVPGPRSRPKLSFTLRGHSSPPFGAEDVGNVSAAGELLGIGSHVR